MKLSASAALLLASLCAGPWCGSVLFAQRPAHFEHPRAAFDHADDLFNRSQYAAAQYELDRIVETTRDPHAPTRIEAEYLSAICAVRLFHSDASVRLLAFMADHPEDLHVGAVRFELFRHYFTNKRWKDCLAWALQVNEEDLRAADVEEFRFKSGYAHFQEGHTEHAQSAFGKVKDGTGPYAVPAKYYTAHIDYERGRYAVALPVFKSLENDPAFGKVVPFLRRPVTSRPMPITLRMPVSR